MARRIRLARAQGLEGTDLDIREVLHVAAGQHQDLAAQELAALLAGRLRHAVQDLDERPPRHHGVLLRGDPRHEHQHAPVGLHLVPGHAGVVEVGAASKLGSPSFASLPVLNARP